MLKVNTNIVGVYQLFSPNKYEKNNKIVLN